MHVVSNTLKGKYIFSISRHLPVQSKCLKFVATIMKYQLTFYNLLCIFLAPGYMSTIAYIYLLLVSRINLLSVRNQPFSTSKLFGCIT
jgi:hypothetical protein